jgi:hypothetical protein
VCSIAECSDRSSPGGSRELAEPIGTPADAFNPAAAALRTEKIGNDLGRPTSKFDTVVVKPCSELSDRQSRARRFEREK